MSNSVEDLIGIFGGVSQQDISLRLAHQVEESINCHHSVSMGTRKRNPTKLVKADTTVKGESFIYSYNRGLTGLNNEKYSLIFNTDGLSMLDLNTGIAQDVTGNIDYLNIFPKDSLGVPTFSSIGYECTTVKDTTFITNRNVEPTTKGTASANVTDIGYIWIKRAEPVDGYDYTVTYNGSTLAKVSGKKTTSEVADAIAALHANFTAYGNIIKVTGCTDLVISDSYGDQASSTFFNSVDSEADLPKSMQPAVGNPVIEIIGTNNYASNYWLIYEDGTWKETVGKDVITQLDETTMPHVITDTGSGFTIAPMDWTDRKCGDEDNSKEPSFIGNQIVDIFFFKNRLGLLTHDSILFSEVGEYYNFWRTTQVATLDSDRIDVDIEAKKAIRLHYVSFLEDDIVIFGDSSQFRVSHEGIFSINSISATLITEYDYNSRVRPLSIDSHIYFLASNGDYNSLYVFSTEGVSEVSRANSVSGHIPKYIDKDIASMVGSSVNSIIFFRSKSNPLIVYVYKYLYDGDQLLQSAWFKWRFSGSVEEIFTTESQLHLLIKRIGSVTEDISVTWNGVWNDDKVWVDSSIWHDNPSTITDNLETIDLVPQEVTEDFTDNGSIVYGSQIKLSEYLPRSGDDVILSAKVNLKTIYVKCDPDSHFSLKIDNLNRNKSRTISEKYVLNRKPYIMGKARDVRISIEGRDDKGFRIDGYSIESAINSRSQQI